MDVTEKRVWKAIRKVWKGHMVRVEAGRGEAEVGTPDGVMSLGGSGIWVELKVWPTEVSREQLAWHIDARQRGAGVVVFCQVARGGYWVGTAETYAEYDVMRPEGVGMKAALGIVKDYIWGYRGGDFQPQ